MSLMWVRKVKDGKDLKKPQPLPLPHAEAKMHRNTQKIEEEVEDEKEESWMLQQMNHNTT